MGDEAPPVVVPALQQDNAQWKMIQQNTFTRWVNKHLAKAGETVDSLDTDLCDGLLLIKLAEVLSHKNVGKHNKKVSFRSQKLENVSVALKFLQEIEKIKIVSIDSTHIVDSNRKLILGLVWTLIVHYSISSHMWEGSDETPIVPDQTPRQRLLAWIRSKLPSDVPVTNFTSDWNDGVALGALVDALAPGNTNVSDWRHWDPDNAVGNTSKAMQLGEEELGIAQLITPDELVNPNIDEKSVMTYLAQFPQARRAIPKGRIARIDEKPTVGVPSDFIVTTPNEQMKPKLSIHDSEGRDVHFILTKIATNEYGVKYTPEKRGPHEISLHLINVETGDGRSTPDATTTVMARLPARLIYDPESRLGSGAVVFTIENAEGALPDDIDVVVLPPSGAEERAIVVGSESDPNTFSAAYTPSVIGLHSVNVFEKRRPLPGSPFPLRVRSHADDLRAWGRGLAAAGIVAGEKVDVNIDHAELPEGDRTPLDERMKRNLKEIPIAVRVIDNETHVAKEAEVTAFSSHLRAFSYVPKAAGDYIVEVTANGSHVGLSPYKVSVSEACRSRVRAFGPGLEGGVAMQPSVFYVESNGERSRLAFAVEGPSQTEIRCQDRGSGSAIVEYTPAIPGVYCVSILAGEEHIKHSPFVLLVGPADANLRPSAVRVSGIDSRGVYVVGRPIEFEIDTTHAGDTLLIPSVSVLDSFLLPIETTVTQLIPSHQTTPLESPSSASGLFACVSIPEHAGQHYINVSVKGVSVPGAPFPVTVVDPSKLRIFGPGVDGPVLMNEPTHFTVDAKQAGPGTLEVALNDREGRAVDIDVLENNDGSFTVKYTAPRPGPYQLKVVFAGAELPKIEINVKPNFDPTGIRVEGLENAVVTVNCEKEVHVFTSNGEKTRIAIRAPSGRVLEAIIEPSESGLRVRFTPPEIGDYTIDVTCEDVQEDVDGMDNSSIDDLESNGGRSCAVPSTSSGESVRGSPSASFHFQAIEEALNRLQEALDGVSNISPVSRRRRHSHEAEYVVAATGPPRAELVRVFGPGLGTVSATIDARVFIDASLAGLGDIDLFVDGPTRTPIHCVDNHNGTCVMNYMPRVPGIYWLRVLFDGRHVTGSPFQIIAVPPLLSSPMPSDIENMEFSLSSGSSTSHRDLLELN